jgi:hypothetical protein
MVWAGIGLDLGYVLVVALLIGVLARVTGGSGGAALGIASILLGLVPLVSGIVLAAAGRTPRLRGLGLGLAIGWGVWLVVAAGVCVAVVAALMAAGPRA